MQHTDPHGIPVVMHGLEALVKHVSARHALIQKSCSTRHPTRFCGLCCPAPVMCAGLSQGKHYRMSLRSLAHKLVATNLIRERHVRIPYFSGLGHGKGFGSSCCAQLPSSKPGILPASILDPDRINFIVECSFQHGLPVIPSVLAHASVAELTHQAASLPASLPASAILTPYVPSSLLDSVLPWLEKNSLWGTLSLIHI